MTWSRVESSTVDPSLAEGLEARVADPMWLLARQWQTGEFRGDDAANPLLVQVETRSLRIERLVLPGGHAVDLDEVEIPLEPLVEREPLGTGPAGATISVELGRLLVRVLLRAGAPEEVVGELRSRFPPPVPDDDGLDPTGHRRLRILAAASIDGLRLAGDLTARSVDLDTVLAGAPGQVRQRLRTVIDAWHATVPEAVGDPQDFTAWNSQRLEYGFELATADDDGDVRLTTADGYPGGRLDWFSFDRAPSNPGSSKPEVLTRRLEVLPTPLRFRGMPAARFWELEEGDVYFGGIETAPEDLARVAVAGYGTVYGDDFLLVPVRLPVGTLTEVTEVTVLDDFGRTTTIPAAAVADGGGDRRGFRFFELSGDPNPKAGRAPLLFLPPTVEVAEASRPLEDVAFLRDETANIAWAVEQRIESAAGNPVDLAARRPRAPQPAAGADGETWRLDLATSVPDNWVPLVPVRLVGDSQPDGTIMLQRGRVPTAAAPGITRGALGQILTPWRRLLVHEEEIPGAGIRVVRRWESARDAAGRLHTWVGRRKGPGRGEGSSGLVFDTLHRSRPGS